ncbi:MAG: TonB family protein [Gemmatimonadetes bacterium]|nr:TonB family protein [Gemmatimonadota bacterium]
MPRFRKAVPATLLAALLAATPLAAQGGGAVDSARAAAVAGSTPGQPVAVPGVEAVGRQGSRAIGDFYRRASRGGGRFVTRAEIERRHPRAMTDLFRGIPSAEVVGTGVRFRSAEGHVPTGQAAVPRSLDPSAGNGMATTGRGRSGDQGQAAGMALRPAGGPESGEAADCVPALYVDGVRWGSAADLGSIRPDDVEGVEVYTRPSTAPAQYRRLNQDCAVVLVWMRERLP